MNAILRLTIVAATGPAGFFDKHGADMSQYTWEHVYLTLSALAVAIVVAVPVGIVLTRTRRERLVSVVLGVAGVIQTVPTLALISFVVLLFVLAGMSVIGFAPTLVALTLYALLPILRNTYTGIRQVSPSVIEVARGMGMTRRQILLRVELPLSLPVIMAGVRISAVWTIGIAALCSEIGAGGLGRLMFQGLRSLPRTADYLVAGTVPAAVLALLFDWILGRIESRLTPAGVRSATPAR